MNFSLSPGDIRKKNKSYPVKMLINKIFNQKPFLTEPWVPDDSNDEKKRRGTAT